MVDIAVKRLSGNLDYIPLSIPVETADIMQSHIGHDVRVAGRFASYNYHDSEGSHLNLSLLVHTYTFLEPSVKNENAIFLDGYLSSVPVFRITPLGRKITELTIAVNYPYLASDYIPCICWNRNALEASLLPCGTHIHIWGRIQSRKYQKKTSELTISTKTTYEISIAKIELPDSQSAIPSLTGPGNQSAGRSDTDLAGLQQAPAHCNIPSLTHGRIPM